MACNVKQRGEEARPRPRESPALSMDGKTRATAHKNVQNPAERKFQPHRPPPHHTHPTAPAQQTRRARRPVLGRDARSRCSTQGDAPPSPPEPTPFGDGGIEGGADPQQRTPRGGHLRRDQRRGRLVSTPLCRAGFMPDTGRQARRCTNKESPKTTDVCCFGAYYYISTFIASSIK